MLDSKDRNAGLDILDKDRKELNFFYLNGIKARSSKVIGIPVVLKDPEGFNGFYKTFKGDLTSNI